MKNISIKISLLKTVLTLIILLWFKPIKAQEEYKITGMIINENNEPISYATIAMENSIDSSIIAGTISNENGIFNIVNNIPGQYQISVSFIGYLPVKKKIDIQNIQSVDLGIIKLQSSIVELDEYVIVAERLKAKQQLNNTIYFINNAMQKTSSTCIDLIKYIPGIQVDLFHNISLEGSQNIIIQVNGIEHDKSFVSQLNSDDIDKIEVNNNPGAKYSSEITGVINIILKKNKNNGISGHVYAEIPTQKNEVYAFPNANINYAFRNLTLFASYNGEFSYFNLEGNDNKTILLQSSTIEILNRQKLKQENWSHGVLFGMDYFLNESNQFNVSGFLRNYSNEHDGVLMFEEKNENTVIDSYQYNKDDTNRNGFSFLSMYFKHLFSNPQKKLVFDMNYYNLKVKNSISFFYEDNMLFNTSNTEPYQNTFNARLNYNTPLNANMKLETGIAQSFTLISDYVSSSFYYRQTIVSPFVSFIYTKQNIHFNVGVRIEYSALNAMDTINKTAIHILPNMNINYDLSRKSNLKFAIQKQMSRPHIHQLNPAVTIIDPYTTQKGNPQLNPAIRYKVSLDYSSTIQNNFISAGVFYEYSSNVIENLTRLSDSESFAKEKQNLGNSIPFGIKTLGSFTFFKIIAINPVVKLYQLQTRGNELAQFYGIKNKNSFTIETSLSAIFSFKNNFTFSTTIKCNSPIAQIQDIYSEDALYFISIDKMFGENLKVGITSAIPCMKEFTNQKYVTTGLNFNEISEQNIIMSIVPIWFKLKYSFNSGKKVNRIKRADDFKIDEGKSGF